jgi:hypothetical protein
VNLGAITTWRRLVVVLIVLFCAGTPLDVLVTEDMLADGLLRGLFVTAVVGVLFALALTLSGRSARE